MAKKKVKSATLGGEFCKVEEIYLYGEAWSEKMHDDHKNFIRVDHRLRDQTRLDSTIHEIMHIQNPRALEKTIARNATEMARLLYRLGWRREGDKKV